MDYKTENKDYQQKSAQPFVVHDCAPLHAAMQLRKRSASVDTPIYETFPRSPLNPFEELQQKQGVSQYIDKKTGEVLHFELQVEDYKLVKTNEENRLQSQIKKHHLLDTASRLLWKKKDKDHEHEQHKTCKCHKVSYVPDNEFIGLKKDEFNHGHVSGLIKCGKFWTCPVCATVIGEKKGADIREMMQTAQAQGYKIELWNFTVPHYADQLFSNNLEAMKLAMEDFWRSYTIRKYKQDLQDYSPRSRLKKFGCGYVGRISNLEVTWSLKNGFHPHFHVLVVSKRNSKSIASCSEWVSVLTKEWQKVLIKHGLQPRTKAGFDNFHRALVIQDGSKAGEYVSKFGTDKDTKLKTKDGKNINWDMADELTKSHAKSGRGLSYTPFDILELIKFADIDNSQRKKLKAVFREYAETVQAKKLAHCRWSKGLRERFNIEPEKTDEEIINERENNAITVGLATKTEIAELTKYSITTKEPTISLLKNLIEKDTANTNEHDLIPRFIYDRSKQKISFTQYLVEYYQRFLPEAEPKKLKSKTNDLFIERSEEQIFIDEIASYDKQMKSFSKGSTTWKALAKVRNNLSRQLYLLQEFNQ